MIENCKFQPTSELNSGSNMEKMDSQEGMIGMGLTSTFHTILMQCSPEIFKVSWVSLSGNSWVACAVIYLSGSSDEDSPIFSHAIANFE